MNIARINTCDIANGTGCRVSVFVSGCNIRCPGCFNKDAQDFNYGHPMTADDILDIINAADHDYIQGISILGGEPLDPANRVETFLLISTVKAMLAGRGKDVWLFTGYDIDEIREMMKTSHAVKDIMSVVDVIKCGPFIKEEKDISLRFRGSRNQKFFSYKDGEFLELNEEEFN